MVGDGADAWEAWPDSAAQSSSSTAVPVERDRPHSRARPAARTRERQEQETRQRLSKKCVEAVMEHRAGFYIVRRCVSMLVCWRDY